MTNAPTDTPETLRAEARQHEQDALDSFERCDTDGFLSQWASGIMAQHKRLEANLAENGGLATFPALFTLDGELAPAKLLETRYGLSWAIFESYDEAEKRHGRILKWVTAFPARESTMSKKGYREGFVSAPAYVDEVGSNACNVHSAYVRSDGGFDRHTPEVDS